MSWILSLSGLLIGVICFLFVHPPPQGFDRSFSQSSSLPPAGFLNTTEGSFIPLDKYLVKKYEPVFGGETVFASNNGDLYTGTIDGYLLRLNGYGGVSKIAHFPGSVLGGVVTPDEQGMYLCVLTTGLVHYDLESGRMEIVSTISDDNLPIRFADDVALAEDGKVYFTDASLVSPWIDQSRNHNAMTASLLDFFAGSGTGRALVYDPVTKSTKTLLDGLKFANGIAVSQNNDYLVVAETFGLRIVRIWIAGPRNGTVDYLTTSLPGVPDGISLASDGGYWVALNCKVCHPCLSFIFLFDSLSRSIPNFS
jgi:sugar lactone lactonase YvrE